MKTLFEITPDMGIADAFQAYREAGEPLQVPKDVIADWIVSNGLFVPQHQDLRKVCAKHLGDYMQKERIALNDGRRARKYLAARRPWNEGERTVQRYLWDDIETCDETFAASALTQMHKAVQQDIQLLQGTYDYLHTINKNITKPIELPRILANFTD